jgi:hypothetical protein
MKTILSNFFTWAYNRMGVWLGIDRGLPVKFFPHYDLLPQDVPIIPAVRYTRGWVASHKEAFKRAVREGPNASGHVTSTHRCPALVTLFSSGYILSAHKDFYIHTTGDIENPVLTSDTVVSVVGVPDPNDDLSRGFMISPTPFPPSHIAGMHRPYPERTPNMIFKLEPAWSAVAPRDVVLLIMGVPFADNNDFTIVPGFTDTQINGLIQPLLWWHHHDRRDLYIKKGTPLLQLIPISRSDLKRGFEIVTDPAERRQQRQFSEEVRYLRESQLVMNYGRLRKSVDMYQAQIEKDSKGKCPFSFLWSK